MRLQFRIAALLAAIISTGCATRIDHDFERTAVLDSLPSQGCVRDAISAIEGLSEYSERASEGSPTSYTFNIRFTAQAGFSLFQIVISQEKGKSHYLLRWESSGRSGPFDDRVRGFARNLEEALSSKCGVPELKDRVREGGSNSIEPSFNVI